MDSSTWELLNWVFLVVPVVIGAVAIRIGSRQVREFHRRTGDGGIIMSVAGLKVLHAEKPMEPVDTVDTVGTPETAAAKAPKRARAMVDAH